MSITDAILSILLAMIFSMS